MGLKIKLDSFSGQLLAYLFAGEQILATMASHPSQWARQDINSKRKSNQSAIYRLIKSGLIEIVEKEGREYFKLTKHGETEALILKAKLHKTGKWDGKWRMVIFDIPEISKNERNKLRNLLLLNDFRKLQASVYISPHPINREAIRYLKETGLIEYIRFARIDELDDDRDIKKKFGL
ncbi:MAG TPA: hypothetical protein VE973_00505 [Candidatus Limnocylindria bacterium]|nr:hypothetical protein [Candidatus Limnocylindria bacterium]